MSDNLGRAVKWLDGPENDPKSGWHTGRVVLTLGYKARCEVQDNMYVNGKKVTYILVQESCDAQLSWVDRTLLQPWASRDEWEDPRVVGTGVDKPLGHFVVDDEKGKLEPLGGMRDY